MLFGSLAATVPSLAQAAAPCLPTKPATQPISITSNSIGTLQISWVLSKPTPLKEWAVYWSETEPLHKVHSAEPALENGTARRTELTNLHPGEPYKVLLALEYHPCVEESSAGNDLAMGWSLAPTVHFYKDLSTTETAGPGELYPAGEVISAKFGQFGVNEEVHSWTILRTVKGNLGNEVSCNKLDSDWTFVDPSEGTATWTLNSWTPSACSQKGYCEPPLEEPVGLKMNNLPLGPIDTYNAYNGYRFSHMKLSFTVTCHEKPVAKIVQSKEINNGVLAGYWSNGRYSKVVPPNLDLDDGPALGGQNEHYEKQYGNGGNMELEGSGGQEVIQPKGEWYYLGYERFAGDIIPSTSP
jgi:hypothetical protein